MAQADPSTPLTDDYLVAHANDPDVAPYFTSQEKGRLSQLRANGGKSRRAPIPLSDEELLTIVDDPVLMTKLTPEERGRLSALRSARGTPERGGAFGRFVEGAVAPLAQAPGMMATVGASLMPTEGGAQARQELGRSLIDPSVERLSMAAQAGREGRPLAAVGNAAAAFPVVGPAIASGVDQMRSGDVAGGAGTLTGIAAPFVAGPLARAGVGSLKGTALGENLAGMADASAANRMVDVMAPKVGPSKARFAGQAAKVAGDIARDPELGAFSRQGLQGKVGSQLDKAAASLDAALAAVPANQHFPTDPIVGRLVAARDRLVVNGPSGSVTPGPRTPAVTVLEQAIRDVQNLGPTASFEELRKLRQGWDDGAKAVYTPSVAADAMKTQAEGRAYADAAGSVREYLAQRAPNAAEANATYHLYKTADDVLQATEEAERSRPKVGRGLMNRMTGAMVGAHEGGVTGGVIGAVAGEIATRAADMGLTFQIAIARRLAAVADALRNGNPVEAQQILERTVHKFPAVKSTLKVTAKMTPAMSVGSSLPLAAYSQEHR